MNRVFCDFSAVMNVGVRLVSEICVREVSITRMSGGCVLKTPAFYRLHVFSYNQQIDIF